MGKAPWDVGQSGNPNGRGRPLRAATGKEADLLRRIGRERVTITDAAPAAAAGGEPGGGPGAEAQTETATFSRLERMFRVLWTQALRGNLGAIRCVLEYVIGKPGRAGADAGQGGGLPTADDMAQLCLFDEEQPK